MNERWQASKLPEPGVFTASREGFLSAFSRTPLLILNMHLPGRIAPAQCSLKIKIMRLERCFCEVRISRRPSGTMNSWVTSI